MGTYVPLSRRVSHGHTYLVARPEVVTYKQPIVFIHGMAGFAGYFIDAMMHKAALGFTCYAHDITGHGERHADDIAGMGIAEYVADASDFIDKVVRPKHGRAPLTLIGHSMGGLIAAKLAEKRNDVGHVVLITPAPPAGVMYLPGGMMRVSIGDVLGALGMAFGGPRFIPSRNFLESLFADPVASKPVIDLWEKRRFSNESLLAALQLGLSQISVDSGMISGPMLVIGTKKDVVVHPSVAGRIASFFDADLHMHEQLGHMCPFEAGWQENSCVIAEWLVRQKMC